MLGQGFGHGPITSLTLRSTGSAAAAADRNQHPDGRIQRPVDRRVREDPERGGAGPTIKGVWIRVMENDRQREPWNRFAEHPIERTQCLPPWRRLGANAFRRNEGSWAWIQRIIGTFFRDLHLRHRTARTDSALLSVELWPVDAGLHCLPRRPDPGVHGRRSEHEVLIRSSACWFMTQWSNACPLGASGPSGALVEALPC